MVDIQRRRIGVVCGGGDCPGLNAVIRAVVHRATLGHGLEVVGIRDSLQGLLKTPPHLRPLDVDAVSGILARGGTILGTTNRNSPFSMAVTQPDGSVVHVNRAADVVSAARTLNLEGILFLGGDGTLAMAHRLATEHGLNVIGIPKTIDNDLRATDVTFGFLSAVGVATEAVDRLHSTAESHDRVMILEVMGRDAGHIALWSGVAGGADVILIPEIPFTVAAVMAKIRQRTALHKFFSIIVVAEGAKMAGGAPVLLEPVKAGHAPRLGGIGQDLATRLACDFGLDTRVTVLGHLQRGGAPVPEDRIIASSLGAHAADMAAKGLWGRMAAIRFPGVTDVPLESAVGQQHLVDPNSALVKTARGLGISLGDGPEV